MESNKTLKKHFLKKKKITKAKLSYNKKGAAANRRQKFITQNGEKFPRLFLGLIVKDSF